MRNKFWSGTITYYNLGENNPPYITIPVMDISSLDMVDEIQKIRKEFSGIIPGAFVVDISIDDISHLLKENYANILCVKFLSKKFYRGSAEYTYAGNIYVNALSWFSNDGLAQTEQNVRKQLSKNSPRYNYFYVNMIDSSDFIRDNFDKIVTMVEEK